MNPINPSNIGVNPFYMVGVVKDVSDPQQRGRARVQWFGYYSEDIPDEQLPWSVSIMPVDSAGMGGSGTSPTGLQIGSFVLGAFLDGADMQIPMIHGVIPPIEGGGSNGTVNANGVNDNSTATNAPSNVNFVGDGPPWMQIARGEIGVKEAKGSANNPRVLEYAKTNGFSDDLTPWCASFAKWCCEKAGVSTSGIDGFARSFTRSPSFEKISSPLHGCITVFSRPPKPTSGHVGFLEKIQGGRLMVVGGNQSNAVDEQGYPQSSLLGFYWPQGASKEGFDFK